jgi:hypothetical protein
MDLAGRLKQHVFRPQNIGKNAESLPSHAKRNSASSHIEPIRAFSKEDERAPAERLAISRRNVYLLQ